MDRQANTKTETVRGRGSLVDRQGDRQTDTKKDKEGETDRCDRHADRQTQ